MARTPVQQGQDARRFDEALANADSDAHEKAINQWVLALLFTGADGKMQKVDNDAVVTRARALQPMIESVNTGMGAFNLLVPADALEDCGFSVKRWDEAVAANVLRKITVHGETKYEIDYTTAITSFLPNIELITSEQWQTTHRTVLDAVREQQSNTTDRGQNR